VVSGIGSSVQLCDMNPMGNRISDFSPVIFEALGFGVVIVDAETHRIVYANSKIYEINLMFQKNESLSFILSILRGLCSQCTDFRY